MNRSWVIVGLGVVLAATGCDGASLASAPASPPPSPSAVVVEPVGEEPSKDLATLRREVENCALDSAKGFGGYGRCPAYGELTVEAPRHAHGFGAMMRWIEDESPAVRQAGAHALYVGFAGSESFADCDAMGRALGALAREGVPINAVALGGVVARFANGCDEHDEALRERLNDLSRANSMSREELVGGLGGPATARPVLFQALAAIAYDARQPLALRHEALDACGRANQRSRTLPEQRVAVYGL